MNDLHSTSFLACSVDKLANGEWYGREVQVLYAEINVNILILMSIADPVMLMVETCQQGWFAH